MTPDRYRRTRERGAAARREGLSEEACPYIIPRAEIGDISRHALVAGAVSAWRDGWRAENARLNSQEHN